MLTVHLRTTDVFFLCKNHELLLATTENFGILNTVATVQNLTNCSVKKHLFLFVLIIPFSPNLICCNGVLTTEVTVHNSLCIHPACLILETPVMSPRVMSFQSWRVKAYSSRKLQWRFQISVHLLPLQLGGKQMQGKEPHTILTM